MCTRISFRWYPSAAVAKTTLRRFGGRSVIGGEKSHPGLSVLELFGVGASPEAEIMSGPGSKIKGAGTRHQGREAVGEDSGHLILDECMGVKRYDLGRHGIGWFLACSCLPRICTKVLFGRR